MKGAKLKSIKDFKNFEVDISKINGGWDGILQTGSGEVLGVAYASDYHFDENRSGTWDAGETVVFSYSPIAGPPGEG